MGSNRSLSRAWGIPVAGAGAGNVVLQANIKCCRCSTIRTPEKTNFPFYVAVSAGEGTAALSGSFAQLATLAAQGPCALLATSALPAMLADRCAPASCVVRASWLKAMKAPVVLYMSVKQQEFTAPQSSTGAPRAVLADRGPTALLAPHAPPAALAVRGPTTFIAPVARASRRAGGSAASCVPSKPPAVPANRSPHRVFPVLWLTRVLIRGKRSRRTLCPRSSACSAGKSSARSRLCSESSAYMSSMWTEHSVR